jgi:alkyl hydroperoxide reductase subunit F
MPGEVETRKRHSEARTESGRKDLKTTNQFTRNELSEKETAMLTREIIDQLREVFGPINQKIGFNMAASDHPKHSELREMLTQLASTSPYLELRETGVPSAVPRFDITNENGSTQVRFEGIPGGHEFTSLIVAILNAAGLGRLPDKHLAAKIKNIRPTAIRTFVSLSCENCPDVVQALNQIALVNGQITHTMSDGELLPDEVERLGIQSVPAVYIGAKLIHSGRASLAELIAKIEAESGYISASHDTNPQDLGDFDVVVAGGGPAGISAAIYAARKGLKTALVAEKLGGQLTETKGIENMISTTYTEGMILTANLTKHLGSYPVSVLEHRKINTITETKRSKEITLASHETLRTKSLIIATGAKWRQLGIPGESEYIGRGVAFCPHCDGPFYKSKPVAVIGGGNSGVEAAIDLSGICSHVTLLEFQDQLKADDVLIKKLHSIPNITVLTGVKTTDITGNGQKVTSLSYEVRGSGERQQLALDGVFVQIGLSPNSGFVKGLVETNAHGEIIVDTKGRTSGQGIYAAGDVTTTPYKQIVIAIGDGAKTALSVFEDMIRAG